MSSKPDPMKKPAARARKRAKATPVPTPQPEAKKRARAAAKGGTPAKGTRAGDSQVKAPRKTAKPKPETQAPAEVQIDEDAGTDPLGELNGLSPREARFVDRYIVCFNGAQAYIEAGYVAKNANVARVGASQLLIRPNVRRHLAARIKAMIARDEEHQDSMMERLKLQAFGDARELTEHHKGSCRYCWGKFHRWQFTAGEWDQKITEHAEKQEKAAEAEKPMPKAPDPKGGTGYTWGREPNPECPECAGHGIGKTIIHDTRHLSPAAAALYAGVKEGKDGIEVKLRDQDKALDTLVKIAKLYDESTTVNVNFDPAELTARYADTMAKAHARTADMRAERERLRTERGD